MSNVLQFI